MKRCTKCGLEKDESEFGKKGNVCRTCTSLRAKAYYIANKNKVLARCRAWAAANKARVAANKKAYREINIEKIICYQKKYLEENREKARETSKEYRRRNLDEVKIKEKVRRADQKNSPIHKAKRMVSAARVRAKKGGYACSITHKDILPIPALCPVMGTPMRLTGELRDADVATLDKLVPALGYIPGNVCVISRGANSIKRNYTINEFELVLAYMKRHAAQQQQQQQEQQQAQQEQEAEPSNT